MIQLSERQRDALAEFINIAFGRTSAALSDLTGQRVVLYPPEVSVCTVDELYGVLSRFIHEEVATVHQIFDGPMAGDAFLVLNYAGAVELAHLFIEGPAPSTLLDASAREVLTEIGNILLNACLGMMGNLLDLRITFSVPRLRLDSLDSLLRTLVIGRDELRYALVVYTRFHLRDSDVGGYLVVALGVNSMEHLIQAVETWEVGYGQG